MIFRNKKQIPDKTNGFVPSDEHKVMHNFIHCQLNNLGYVFRVAQLRDLYDFYLLGKRVPEKDVVNISKEQKKLACYYGLSSRVFNQPQHTSVVENKTISGYRRSFEWYSEHPRQHRRYIFRMKIKDFIFHRFFPGSAKIFRIRYWMLLFRNITDPDWYKHLAFRIKNFQRNYIRK